MRSGVDSEDALEHLSTLLKGAFATNLKALELVKDTCRDLLLSNDHGLDSAKAVVEALLDGVEAQQLAGTGKMFYVYTENVNRLVLGRDFDFTQHYAYAVNRKEMEIIIREPAYHMFFVRTEKKGTVVPPRPKEAPF